MNTDILFRPFTLGNVTLKNRIVMAPMTRQRSPGEVPGDAVARYYARRAAGGAGLILTEGTTINHPAAANAMDVPNFYDPKALENWGLVAKAVHEAGGKIFPQLWHTGMHRDPTQSPRPQAPSVGPSGVKLKGDAEGVALSQGEIDDVIESYAVSAEAAKRLGFDGIEIHAAHGFLIDQFFWAHTNRRTDKYGGDMIGRTRFAAEIVSECRRRTGAGFPISFRFSQWKIAEYKARLAETPEELGRLLAPLVDAGVSIFHCSTRKFWDPAFEGSDRTLAGWTKQVTGLPAIAVGSAGLNGDYSNPATAKEIVPVDNLDRLAELAERGEFDLIAVGRAMIVDPDWAEKVRTGRANERRPYDPELQRSNYD